MQRCPFCRTRLEYHPDSCPECLRSLRPEDVRVAESRPEGMIGEKEPVRTIARFANAAEAGFFAHVLLSMEDIPAEIRTEDDYDGIAGYWSTRFLLDVPARLAKEAGEILQQVIDRSEREDFVGTPAGRLAESDSNLMTASRYSTVEVLDDSAAESRPGLRWTPIVLTIAAGSLAFFGLRTMQQQAGKAQRNIPVGKQDELWQQMGQPMQPWTQQLPGNRRRELRFNADRTRAVLREYQGDQKISESEFRIAR